MSSLSDRAQKSKEVKTISAKAKFARMLALVALGMLMVGAAIVLLTAMAGADPGSTSVGVEILEPSSGEHVAQSQEFWVKASITSTNQDEPITATIDEIGERLSGIEATLKGIKRSIDLTNKRIDGLRNNISENRAEIRDMRAHMGTQFRWTLFLIITMWVTITLTFLFRG